VGFVPYILVDKVRYNDVAPWPTNAAGTGFSLQRNINPGYGNDPTNWTAAAPTAGKPNALGITITSQPQSQPVLVKGTAVLNVGVEGTAPIYQWFKQGKKIKGATASSLTITNASQLRSAGTYSVFVTNFAGGVMSSNATLKVITPVRFISQPQRKTVLPGRSTTITARATGTAPIAYQWWQNGSPLLNATNSRLTVTNCQPVINEGVYTATASNVLSGAVSFPAALTVKTNSP
jgi:hypothetical protein